MKVFQQLRDAINEWEQSRDTILKIAAKLDCSESEIMGKIEQLQNARPANDLNAIHEKLAELEDAVTDGMGRAEDVESAVNNAFNELEYVDANDAVMAFSDVASDLEEFRNDIKKQLDESRG